VATFNVHMWCDANHMDNYERVRDLVKIHNPDFLCLQEAYRRQSGDLAKELNYDHHESWMTCSILSRIPYKLREYRNNRKAKFLTAEIEIDDHSPLHLTCLHLNHQTEPKRLSEIEFIKNHLEPVFQENSSQIWTGDFNALTKEDYLESEWNDIINKDFCGSDILSYGHKI